MCLLCLMLLLTWKAEVMWPGCWCLGDGWYRWEQVDTPGSGRLQWLTQGQGSAGTGPTSHRQDCRGWSPHLKPHTDLTQSLLPAACYSAALSGKRGWNQSHNDPFLKGTTGLGPLSQWPLLKGDSRAGIYLPSEMGQQGWDITTMTPS